LRLPSDSGSDPDAVRATAEDIFGEADDISEDEKEKEAQVLVENFCNEGFVLYIQCSPYVQLFHFYESYSDVMVCSWKTISFSCFIKRSSCL